MTIGTADAGNERAVTPDFPVTGRVTGCKHFSNKIAAGLTIYRDCNAGYLGTMIIGIDDPVQKRARWWQKTA